MSHEFNIGLCQMKVVSDKKINLNKAEEMIRRCAGEGCMLAILPEMFCCPYDTALFAEYAESSAEGPVYDLFSRLSCELGIIIVGGSMPERSQDGSIYNTSLIFNADGRLIGRHRKAHLFDVDIKGKISFKESEILKPGNEVTVVDTPLIKIGVGICYDIRFPELSRAMVLKGAELLIFPAVFNNVTGPAHWEILMRTRAVDNQVYVAGVSPSFAAGSSYQSHGHSMLADPWGSIAASASLGEELVIGSINLEKIYEIRASLPLLHHRRPKLY